MSPRCPDIWLGPNLNPTSEQMKARIARTTAALLKGDTKMTARCKFAVQSVKHLDRDGGTMSIDFAKLKIGVDESDSGVDWWEITTAHRDDINAALDAAQALQERVEQAEKLCEALGGEILLATNVLALLRPAVGARTEGSR